MLFYILRFFFYCPFGVHYFGGRDGEAGAHLTWKYQNPTRKCVCCGTRQWFEYEKGWKGKPIKVEKISISKILHLNEEIK